MAEHGVVYRLASEYISALDSLASKVQEVVWKRSQSLLDELQDLRVFEFFAGFLVRFDIVVNKDRLELGWQVFVEDLVDKVLVLSCKGSLPVVLFLRQIQAHEIATVLLEKHCKVLFGALVTLE